VGSLGSFLRASNGSARVSLDGLAKHGGFHFVHGAHRLLGCRVQGDSDLEAAICDDLASYGDGLGTEAKTTQSLGDGLQDARDRPGKLGEDKAKRFKRDELAARLLIGTLTQDGLASFAAHVPIGAEWI
jgi:hypothetical protein